MQDFDNQLLPTREARRAATPGADRSSPLVARSLEEGTTHALDADGVLKLQRTAGNASVTELLSEESESPVTSFLAASRGDALDGETRSGMEAALGADFSDVRVHRGGAAAQSAASVQARAYTVGQDVVLGGDVDTSSSAGQRTLAHELTHVVQQRSGPVDGTPAPGGIQLSDPSDRFEQAAEATAEAVVGGHAAPAASAGQAGGGTAQREAAPTGDDKDEDQLQGSFLQREGAAPEEEDEEAKKAAPA